MNVMKSFVRYDDIGSSASSKNNVYFITPNMGRGKFRICPYCKEKYEYHRHWVHYMVGKKEFCSWNCKCAYERGKEEEKINKLKEQWENER